MKSDTALDDVEFLAASPNRVTVLQRLRDGPATRRDLHDETGVSQPTLGRILEGFSERGWATGSRGTYKLTSGGALVAESFASLTDTVETVRRLRAVAPLLPVERLPFDLRELRDARLTLPRAPDVEAHLRRAEELVDEARTVRSLSATMYLDAISTQHELVGQHGQVQEVVIGRAALDMALARPAVVVLIRDLLTTPRMSLYATDEPVPFSLGLVDDVAIIVPYDQHGAPCALLESTNPVVRDWVVETLDGYRDRATRLTAESLPAVAEQARV